MSNTPWPWKKTATGSVPERPRHCQGRDHVRLDTTRANICTRTPPIPPESPPLLVVDAKSEWVATQDRTPRLCRKLIFHKPGVAPGLALLITRFRLDLRIPRSS